MRDPHSPTAATRHRLYHDRVTYPFGYGECSLLVLRYAFRPGRDRHTGLPGEGTADRFVFEGVHCPRIRPDETDVAALANVGEMSVFRKKTVTRVNRIDIGDFRRADDPVNAKIAFAGRSFADANGFVGELNVHGIDVRFRIDGHSPDVQFLTRTDDAYGNFPTIRYQNFFKHAVSEAVH